MSEMGGVGVDGEQDAVVLFLSRLYFTLIFYHRHICFQYPHMWLQLDQETHSLLVERFGLSFAPTKHQFLSSAGETPGK